jgi:hypothetical protein
VQPSSIAQSSNQQQQQQQVQQPQERRQHEAYSDAGSVAGGQLGIGGMDALNAESNPTSPSPVSPSPQPTDAAAAAGAGSTPGRMAQQHRSYVDADGAVVIGRLRVGPKELGFGSAGECRVLQSLAL